MRVDEDSDRALSLCLSVCLSVCRAIQEISCLLYIFVEAEAEEVVSCVLNVILGLIHNVQML